MTTVSTPDRESEPLACGALFTLDEGGRVRSWGDDARALFGYSAAEILLAPVSRLFAPAEGERASIDVLLQRARVEGASAGPGAHVRRDGSRFSSLLTLTKVHARGEERPGYAAAVWQAPEGARDRDATAGTQAHLALLVASVKDYAIFMLDAEGRVATWSAGAEAIKGYRADEVRGRHVSLFYTPEDRAADLPGRLLERAAREGHAENEGWRIRKDGTRFWADATITAMRDADGALLGFGKVTRDLSERRAASEALRQSEERHRLLVSSVKDYAIFMLDPDGRVATWSAGAEAIKGYRLDEVRGHHISLFYTREDRDARLPERLLEQAAREGRVESEGWRRRKDGSRFWADVVITALRDSHGRLIGYGKVTRDLTERKRTEDLVATVARQQAAVAMLGRHALESVDLPTVLQFAAEAVASTLDVPIVEVCRLDSASQSLIVVGRVGLDAAPAPRPIDGGSSAVRSMTGGGPVVTESYDAPGAPPRESHLEGLRVARSAWVGILSSVEDAPASGALGIHAPASRELASNDLDFLRAIANILATAVARRRAEQALLAAEQAAATERVRSKQAEVALRERDEFISVAAHELRTPLTALKLRLDGVFELLRREQGQDPGGKIVPRIEAGLRQVERLQRLIERLLDVSRIAADRLELVCDPFDLRQLVREVLDDFREEAAQARSPLNLHAPEPVEGVWDRARMEQCVANVVSNAIKYGGGKPVDVTLEKRERTAVVRVTDRGIGLDQEAAARIFDRFIRAAPLRNYGGLGLGLYIVRHLIEAHGGRIDVQSRPGAGATFELEVPLESEAGCKETHTEKGAMS